MKRSRWHAAIGSLVVVAVANLLGCGSDARVPAGPACNPIGPACQPNDAWPGAGGPDACAPSCVDGHWQGCGMCFEPTAAGSP